MRDDVKRVTIQLVRPQGNDMGAVEEGFYIVERGEVTLTDAAGEPLERSNAIRRKRITWSRKLAKEEDAHRVVKQLQPVFLAGFACDAHRRLACTKRVEDVPHREREQGEREGFRHRS